MGAAFRKLITCVYLCEIFPFICYAKVTYEDCSLNI